MDLGFYIDHKGIRSGLDTLTLVGEMSLSTWGGMCRSHQSQNRATQEDISYNRFFAQNLLEPLAKHKQLGWTPGVISAMPEVQGDTLG